MPVLPRLLHRSPTTDTRLLESRQPHTTFHSAANAVSQPLYSLTKRIANLIPRQSGGAVLAIPTQYAGLNAGPSPGVVAGIVLGSIAGFLFLIWILWVVSTSGTGFIRSTNLVEEDIVVRRRSRSRGTKRSRRTEMTSRSPRRERVVRQERIIRNSVPPPRDSSRFRETILVDEIRGGPPERRVDGDDIVEVIEEHSSIDVPPPRRKGRRSSQGYR